MPLTVWPLPCPRTGRRCPDVCAGVGRAWVEAVVQRVLACYPASGGWLVVDDDSPTTPQTLEDATCPPVGLVVVVSRAAAGTEPWALGSRLAPGGLLVIVLPSTITVGMAGVVAAARAAGLRYLQHNVAFPVPLAGPGPQVAVSRVCARAHRHARIHADVLVFASPGR